MAHQVNYRGYNRAEEHDVNANWSIIKADGKSVAPREPIKNALNISGSSDTLTKFEGCTDLEAHGNWLVKQRSLLPIPLPTRVAGRDAVDSCQGLGHSQQGLLKLRSRESQALEK